ncbi:hypothetical protein G6F64_014414 [Rhizopus arrhizus]|uniref:Uncharacterized protein n=1 Tax=Rhizopus oryzae TaxID=64495 RepID=A0A9P6WTX7_RHIOR|nr:hypothetical protein G6F64_014414 [Rhizopus arrhizus]
MPAAFRDLAGIPRAGSARGKRGVQLIEQRAKKSKPQSGVDASARQLHVTGCQCLPGTLVHRRNRVAGGARFGVGVLPAEKPPWHAPIGFQPAAMQRAAQHQGQLPREQYGLVLRIAQAERTGAVYRLAGQPGTPARDGSRLTAESWQQHRELKRIGFQGVSNLGMKPVQ